MHTRTVNNIFAHGGKVTYKIDQINVNNEKIINAIKPQIKYMYGF